MAKRKKQDPFSKEVIKAKRTFPTGKTIGIIVLILIQITALTIALIFDPQPQDKIDLYELTVTPREDGTLDIDYSFTWTALDEDEELTWIDIGMPNENFGFYRSSFSSTIDSYEKVVDGNYVSARLYLDRPYEGGETLSFSFRIHQTNMLCKNDDGYFYELVPGWFNSTPVESYRFVWKSDLAPEDANADTDGDGYYIWEGSMDCGDYVPMRVQYDSGAFVGASTVSYREFNGDVNNELRGDKIGAVIMAIVLCIFIIIIQIYMVDSIVSYHRGRGFLTGYGHHIHIYGRTNPKYRDEADKHAASSGTRSGGGCACACACACAGGGRAGCSQKDTVSFAKRKAKKQKSN